MAPLKNILATVLLIVLWVFLLSPGNNRADSWSLFASTAYAEETGRNHIHGRNPAPISDLIVTLVTRTGATDPSAAEMLRQAAGTSAAAFRETLGHHASLRPFANGLEGTLSAFSAEYEAANQNSDVIAARAAAVDKLFRNVLLNAEQTAISREKLELALLSAFSDLQSKMSAQPLISSLTAADRELLNLLMLASVHQVHRRSMLDNGVAAVTTLNVDPTLSEHYIKTISILDASMLNEMARLERVVGNPAIIQNSAALVTEQYNLEAINDLFWLRYQLELASVIGSGWISTMDVMARVVGRMNDVGGIMSNVTVTDLMQSGVARSSEPYWSLAEVFAYDWVRPDMRLHYRPIAGLVDELLRLGGSVPVSPDFSLYTNPYFAIFQLKYDFDLCNSITTLEWNQARNVSATGLLTMTEMHALRLSQQERRSEILKRVWGASRNEKQALPSVFMIPL